MQDARRSLASLSGAAGGDAGRGGSRPRAHRSSDLAHIGGCVRNGRVASAAGLRRGGGRGVDRGRIFVELFAAWPSVRTSAHRWIHAVAHWTARGGALGRHPGVPGPGFRMRRGSAVGRRRGEVAMGTGRWRSRFALGARRRGRHGSRHVLLINLWASACLCSPL